VRGRCSDVVMVLWGGVHLEVGGVIAAGREVVVDAGKEGGEERHSGR
jgi:hypothetical protein